MRRLWYLNYVKQSPSIINNNHAYKRTISTQTYVW